MFLVDILYFMGRYYCNYSIQGAQTSACDYGGFDAKYIVSTFNRYYFTTEMLVFP